MWGAQKERKLFKKHSPLMQSYLDLNQNIGPTKIGSHPISQNLN